VGSNEKPLIYDASLGHSREMVVGTDSIHPAFVSGGSGLGDVIGPASSTDLALPRFDGTNGKTLQESGVLVSDSDSVSGVVDLTMTGNLTISGTVDTRNVSADGLALDGHIADDDPHSGTLPRDGTRAMTGALDMGAQAITNVGNVDGVDVSALSTTVAAIPASITAAVLTETNNRIADVDAEEAARIAADAVLTSAVAAIDGANVASTGDNIPPVDELELFIDRTGDDLRFRTIAGEQGLEAEVVGNSVRVRRRARLWAPSQSSPAETYQIVRHKGRRTAGATGSDAATGPDYEPADLATSHGTGNHLYPYMIYTACDTHGYPHHFHSGLRGNYALTTDQEGYEFGEPVAAGDARVGNRFEWDLSCAVENAGWMDSFLEFAVEINPTIGDYAGADLMRLLSPELGATWAGEIPLSARIVLEVTGADSCKLRGEFTLFSSTGAVLREWRRSASLSSAHNWLTGAARLQLRWRVDKGLAAQDDVFSGEFQGERQDANTLRLHVDQYLFTPVGLGGR
jgi:hypothetical protein